MSVPIPLPPSDQPVSMRREVYELLTLVDLTRTGRRVLDTLIAHHSPETGTAQLTQDQVCAILAASKPSVNRGFQQLYVIGLAWMIEDGRYQLHPLLTGGAVASPVMSVPTIKVVAPAEFGELQRKRFAAQLASLGLSA